MTAPSALVRIAVVGLGHMGTRHARCIAAHPRATLAIAVETDATRAGGLELDCPIVTDARALIGKADAAIIAVPTAAHVDIAVPLLEAGIDCLIEKPVAATAEDIARIAAAAKVGGAVVRVGHVERFNPAVVALLADPPHDIRMIAARRISGASARVTDIDVVMDLMVHDIDIVLALKQAPITAVNATGNRDNATAEIAFGDGGVATLTASRVAPGLIRTLDVQSGAGALHLDYLARTLTRDGVPCDVHAADALTTQLSAFLDARTGAETPVTLDDAAAVMQLTWRIQTALKL